MLFCVSIWIKLCVVRLNYARFISVQELNMLIPIFNIRFIYLIFDHIFNIQFILKIISDYYYHDGF